MVDAVFHSRLRFSKKYNVVSALAVIVIKLFVINGNAFFHNVSCRNTQANIRCKAVLGRLVLDKQRQADERKFLPKDKRLYCAAVRRRRASGKICSSMKQRGVCVVEVCKIYLLPVD